MIYSTLNKKKKHNPFENAKCHNPEVPAIVKIIKKKHVNMQKTVVKLLTFLCVYHRKHTYISTIKNDNMHIKLSCGIKLMNKIAHK